MCVLISSRDAGWLHRRWHPLVFAALLIALAGCPGPPKDQLESKANGESPPSATQPSTEGINVGPEGKSPTPTEPSQPGNAAPDPTRPGRAGTGEPESSASGKAPSSSPTGRPRIAYVTNGVADFWSIAKVGAEQAGRQFECEVLVRMPTAEGGRVANQNRIVEELLASGVDGIAISPIDPVNQQTELNHIGERCLFITHDSDAPQSNRLFFIGISNYEAGRACGELVRQAIPDGGQIVIFIGSQDQDNSRLRRQGVIDEVLQRSPDATRYDPPGTVVKNDRYTILETMVDEFDDARKRSQPELALSKYPSLDCMVGLFEYNPPFILEALRDAGRIGEVQVVGFDENFKTLEAIAKGDCIGTVVQDPYMYGFESVRMLATLARGDRTVIPESGFVDIPARKITAANVAAFETQLRARLGK